MKKQLNEEINKIKKMMGSIINEDFENSNLSNETPDMNCESNILDSDTLEVIVFDSEWNKKEAYLVSVGFDHEEAEPETYENPGYGGSASGYVDGIKMIHPEERMLDRKEVNMLLSKDEFGNCVYSAIEEMEETAHENRPTGPDPDEDYERRRDADYE